MTASYQISSSQYGVVNIQPPLSDEDEIKVRSINRPELDITIQPQMELLGGNSYHSQYGFADPPSGTSVLLPPGEWHKTNQLVEEIKNVLGMS